MAEVLYDNLEACTDCAIWHANNDDSGSERTGEELTRAFLNEWDGWPDVITGTFPHVVITGEDSYFSSRACDICGTNLAGDRIDAALIG